jgi:streptogramin lyase
MRAVVVVPLVMGGCLGWPAGLFPPLSGEASSLPDCPTTPVNLPRPGATDGGQPGCADQARFIYVVDEDGQFSRFDPERLSFTDLGRLDCPAAGGETPFAMTVDRTGRAWVAYTSGEIFWVDPATVACTAVPFLLHQHGLEVFALAFVSDGPGSATDTIFLAGGARATWGTGPVTLARMDPERRDVTPLCRLRDGPDLSGTGSGALWGYFQFQDPPRVTRLDPATGAPATSYPLPTLAGQPHDWAFAFWGGDLWVFLKRQADFSTDVYRVSNLDAPSPTVTGVVRDTLRRIVGAGVSTCAPVQIR